jgi:hypothetical protein
MGKNMGRLSHNGLLWGLWALRCENYEGNHPSWSPPVGPEERPTPEYALHVLKSLPRLLRGSMFSSGMCALLPRLNVYRREAVISCVRPKV